MDPIATARAGLLAASTRFEASAERTVRLGADDNVEPASEAVEQIGAKHQFAANLGVIRIADEMWRSLLDIQAKR